MGRAMRNSSTDGGDLRIIVHVKPTMLIIHRCLRREERLGTLYRQLLQVALCERQSKSESRGLATT